MSNYLRASLSEKTNEIVSFKPLSFQWVQGFRDSVLAEEEAAGVEIYVAQEDCNGGKGFDVKKGESVLKVAAAGKKLQVSRPHGAVRAGSLPAKKLRLKPRAEWTCADVCDYVIKPQCMDIESYYTDLLVQKDPSLVRERDFQDGVFVSYARQMRFNDLVDALANLFGNVSSSGVYVWIDLFCANQPKLDEAVTAKKILDLRYGVLSKGLHHAVGKLDRQVVVFDSWKDPSVLKRAWCVWEIFGVALAHQEIEIAMPEREETAYLQAIQNIKTFGDVVKSVVAIDVKSAKCYNKKDLEIIHEAISQQSSFAEVNNAVLTKLREWHVAIVQKVLKQQGGAETIERASLLNSLAQLLELQGKLGEVESLYMEALKIQEKLLGENHFGVATTLNNYGQLLQRQSRLEEAEPVMRRALQIDEAALGKDHALYAIDLNNLASLLQKMGKLEEAEPLKREGLAISEKLYGKKHEDYALKLNNLAQLLKSQEKYEEAQVLLLEALQIFKEVKGNNHPDVAVASENLAAVLTKQGKLEEAEPLMRDVVRINEKAYGKIHPLYAEALDGLAYLLSKKNKKSKEAARLGKEALHVAEKTLGKAHPTSKRYREYWG